MTDLELLRARLAKRFPSATASVDLAEMPTGSSWLDLSFPDGYNLTIEASPDRGFGLSAGGTPGYGEGPDEVFMEMSSLEVRVVELLKVRGPTIPPVNVLLAQLREMLNVSQEVLAERLGMYQSTISKMERRSDMLVSTLRKVVAALGGRLEIRAIFADNDIRITQFDRSEDAQPTSPASSRKAG